MFCSWSQSFDTVGWMIGRASGLEKSVPLIPKVSFSEQMEEETSGESADLGSPGKLQLKWRRCYHKGNSKQAVSCAAPPCGPTAVSEWVNMQVSK